MEIEERDFDDGEEEVSPLSPDEPEQSPNNGMPMSV